MKEHVRFEVEKLSDGRSARIWAHLSVDGVPCGSTVIVSGPINEVQRLYEGKVTFPQYQAAEQARNVRLTRTRTRAIEQNSARLGKPRRTHA